MGFDAISIIKSMWDNSNPWHMLVDRAKKVTACGLTIGSNFTVDVLVTKQFVTCEKCKSTKRFKELK